MFFHIHKRFLGPDNVVRQDTDAEGKLQNSHYNCKRKTWEWDMYVALHKEQQAIMESITDYGYSGMDNGTKVRHVLQVIKCSELEAAVHVVRAHPEKYGMDFDTVVSYLGQMVTKKGLIMQSVWIATTRSQPMRPEVAAFMENLECKKYSKAV